MANDTTKAGINAIGSNQSGIIADTGRMKP